MSLATGKPLIQPPELSLRGVPTQGKDLHASQGDMLGKLGLIFCSMKRSTVLQLLDSVLSSAEHV